MASLLLLLMLLCSPLLQAAQILSQDNATLLWQGARAAAQSNVQVLRYEKIGLYRYDPASSVSTVVHASQFADVDSLSGSTPQLTGPLPEPMNLFDGMPLTLGQAIPLRPAADELLSMEPLFVLLEGPILPAGAIGVRPDGRRYVAVTLDV
ncbi:MAG TPA: hypothetical protein VIN71_01520, partial [Pseudomonadales bacterium]